jgi:hypothetical protein
MNTDLTQCFPTPVFLLGWTAPTAPTVLRQRVVINHSQEKRPMGIIRIGLDTSKSVFQVYGVDEQDRPALRRQFCRGQ